MAASSESIWLINKIHTLATGLKTTERFKVKRPRDILHYFGVKYVNRHMKVNILEQRIPMGGRQG